MENKTISCIKTNWTFILIMVLIALLVFQCNGSKKSLSNLEQIHKDKIDNANAKINDLAIQNSNIEIQKELLKSKNEKLVSDNILLSKSILQLKADVKGNLSKVKIYSKADIALFYGKRYNLPSEVKTTENGTEISDTIAKRNISELISFDGTFAELEVTKRVLENTTNEVVQKDSLWHLTEKQLSNSTLSLSQKDIVIGEKDIGILDLKSELKKQSVNKNIWKLATYVSVGLLLKMILVK